jgi:hypothetical protein
VIVVRSLTAPSMSLASRDASPTPMLTTAFSGLGTCMMLARSNSFRSCARSSSLKRFFKRGT